ncbi:MAG: hypothetical protein JXB47_13240 [Anaerolineae bacterium]|nr:hypothetical protein [Anaerolineae bacterium]
MTLCYVTLCSAEKRDDPGDLPALDRYISARIRAVYKWAQRDGADFRIFSGKFGLLRADDPVPWYDQKLVAEDVSAAALRVAGQLRAEAFEKLVVYTDEVKVVPDVLVYVGCLMVAAGTVGGIVVEHREM